MTLSVDQTIVIITKEKLDGSHGNDVGETRIYQRQKFGAEVQGLLRGFCSSFVEKFRSWNSHAGNGTRAMAVKAPGTNR